MSSFREAAWAFALACVAAGAQADTKGSYPGIGRAATPQEIAAWDIDVRPDFKGLPVGAGSVAKGQEVWEAKCASCHGVFGESNEVFSPLVGGTSEADIQAGHVASLQRRDYPARTTLMKVSSLSTLWDYINRAMPWTQPKSLSVEEVYAVTAYLLNLGGVVPADFTLSDKNVREVQQRLPNRNGTTTAHALWPGKEFGGKAAPDVAAKACMKDCAPEPRVASLLPSFARNSHGNLAEQNRSVGAQRGADTSQPEPVAGTAPPPRPAGVATAGAATPSSETRIVQALTQKNNCTACHAFDSKLVGPSWADIARKNEGKPDYLAAKIKSGGTGSWGAITMPPQSLSDAEAKQIATWLATGALH
jgi:cytochrome c